MGKSAMKFLSVLAAGIVLAHLFPFAMGMLLCVGDGADPDCCSKRNASRSRADETQQLRDGSDCSCCIPVDAAPSTAGTTSQKASVDALSASGVSRIVVSPKAPGITRPGSDDRGNARLSRLRTVVLLI